MKAEITIEIDEVFDGLSYEDKADFAEYAFYELELEDMVKFIAKTLKYNYMVKALKEQGYKIEKLTKEEKK